MQIFIAMIIIGEENRVFLFLFIHKYITNWAYVCICVCVYMYVCVYTYVLKHLFNLFKIQQSCSVPCTWENILVAWIFFTSTHVVLELCRLIQREDKWEGNYCFYLTRRIKGYQMLWVFECLLLTFCVTLKGWFSAINLPLPMHGISGLRGTLSAEYKYHIWGARSMNITFL